MENRHGLVVQATAVVGTGTAEREVAIARVAALPRGRETVGGDKGYDHARSSRRCARSAPRPTWL